MTDKLPDHVLAIIKRDKEKREERERLGIKTTHKKDYPQTFYEIEQELEAGA